ncbi:MAG: hypothetical protein ACLFR2_08540 [Candidatus Kapaibacterium sp.]
MNDEIKQREEQNDSIQDSSENIEKTEGTNIESGDAGNKPVQDDNTSTGEKNSGDPVEEDVKQSEKPLEPRPIPPDEASESAPEDTDEKVKALEEKPEITGELPEEKEKFTQPIEPRPIQPGEASFGSPDNIAGAADTEPGDIIKYETEEQYADAVQKFASEIEEIKKASEDTKSWKQIKIQLSEARERVKGLFLKEEDTQRLHALIDEVLEQVKDNQEKQKEKFLQEFKENYEKLKPIVEDSIKTALESDKFKKAREILIKTQNEVKNTRLQKIDREQLNNKIQETFEEVSRKQAVERENYEMETIENYHTLKKIVDDACNFADKTEQFRSGRKKLIDAQSNIKGKKLKKDQRDELYGLIRESFNNLNKRQEKERSEFNLETDENYNKIRPEIDEAIAFAATTDDFGQARQQLINMQKKIKELKLRREHRDKLYGDIRKIFNELNAKQTEDREEFSQESMENYKKLSDRVDEAFVEVENSGDFGLIRDTLIAVQSEIKFYTLKREHRNELFSRIREAFKLFDEKRKEYRDRRKEEKKHKLADNIKDIEASNTALAESIMSDKALLETELKKLEELSGTTENTARNVIESNIEDIKKRIGKKEAKIEENNNKITEIKAELEKAG